MAIVIVAIEPVWRCTIAHPVFNNGRNTFSIESCGAVLHTLEEERVPDIIASLSDTGLPNLFIPRIDQFVWVEAIPILGTGKLDLTEVKRRAATALSVDSGK